MRSYVLRRAGGRLALLLGITVLCFAVIHLTPGDPTEAITELNPKISLQARQRIIEFYYLDDPLPVQYARWIASVARLDFGRSIADNRPVTEKIAERIPVTLAINVLSMGLMFLIGIPLGLLAAAKPDSAFDRLTTVLVFLGFSVPTFWLALVLMRWLGVQWQWLPVSGVRSLGAEAWPWWRQWLDMGHHLMLPIGVSAIA